jgi:hypothetical protein
MDFKRRKHERAVAAKIASELHRVLGPIAPETLAVKSEVTCKVFSEVFDYYGVTESAAERILHLVPAILADLNLKFAELNSRLDAVIRQPLTRNN